MKLPAPALTALAALILLLLAAPLQAEPTQVAEEPALTEPASVQPAPAAVSLPPAFPPAVTSSADSIPATASDDEETVITSLVSLDFMLLATQIFSGGIGFGMGYERQIFPHYAFKGYFGHATMNTKYRDWYCTTVSFSLAAEWYPLSRQMRRLYVGAGSGFDYFGYISKSEDSAVLEEAAGETLSVTGTLGYKFSLPRHWLLDASVGYKYAYDASNKLYGSTRYYLKSGLQYGLSLKRVLKKKS